jgi:hypothetical protein
MSPAPWPRRILTAIPPLPDWLWTGLFCLSLFTSGMILVLTLRLPHAASALSLVSYVLAYAGAFVGIVWGLRARERRRRDHAALVAAHLALLNHLDRLEQRVRALEER